MRRPLAILTAGCLALCWPSPLRRDGRPPVTAPRHLRRHGGRAGLEASGSRSPSARKGRPGRHDRQGDPGRRRLRRPARRRHGQDPAGHLPAAQRRLPAVQRPPARQRRRHGPASRSRRVTTKLAADSRLVRPGDHARRRRRLPGRRRRLPALQEPARRRRRPYVKRTLVARTGNRFKLDRPCARTSGGWATPTACHALPARSPARTSPTSSIENLDARRQPREEREPRRQLRRLRLPPGLQPHHDPRASTARNYNGDGISWQICHDVLVEDCHSHDNAELGLHPGSGSQRPVIRNNKLERQRHRPLLLLGRQVRPGREEPHRGQPRRRHLDRPPRHRQPHPRQRDPRQRQGRRPVPAGARQGVRRPPQPDLIKNRADRQRRRRPERPSTSRAGPSRSSWSPTG